MPTYVTSSYFEVLYIFQTGGGCVGNSCNLTYQNFHSCKLEEISSITEQMYANAQNDGKDEQKFFPHGIKTLHSTAKHEYPDVKSV